MSNRSMCIRGAVLAILTAGIAGIATAQSVTTDIREGEILWVQGNTIVVRGPEGVKKFEVDESVRFNLDGKEVSVHELKPGTKFTAQVTTTTTPVQEYVTEVKEAEVINVMGSTIVVKNANGEYKRFTADSLKGIDITMMKDGKSITASELRKGDRVTATIITPLPPSSVSETELAVALSSPPPPPKPAPAAQAAPAAAPPAEPKPKALPKTASPLPVIGIAGLIALALGASLSLRRRWHASR
jgi:LPXTG-motif cell wall-anchored protein